MGLEELLVGGVVTEQPLMVRRSSVEPPNRNSHLARAIFCDRRDGVFAEPLSDSVTERRSLTGRLTTGSLEGVDRCSGSHSFLRTKESPLQH